MVQLNVLLRTGKFVWFDGPRMSSGRLSDLFSNFLIVFSVNRNEFCTKLMMVCCYFVNLSVLSSFVIGNRSKMCLAVA